LFIANLAIDAGAICSVEGVPEAEPQPAALIAMIATRAVLARVHLPPY
jgi:hypothetical protein